MSVLEISKPLDAAPSRAHRARGRSLSMAVSFVLLAATVVAVPLIPGGDLAALNALMVGALVAYLRFRAPREGPDVFEIVIPLSAIFFLYFGASSIYIRLSSKPLLNAALRPYLVPALALAAVAYLSLLAGYALIGGLTRPSPFRRLTIVHPLVPIGTGWVGALGLSAQRWQGTSVLSGSGINPGISALQQFGAFFFFGWFIAWYEFWAGRLKGLAALLVLGSLTLATAMVTVLTLGWKSLVIAILALPGMAYYEVRRRVPYKALCVVLLVGVFVVFPFFNTYRNESKFLSQQERIDATIDTTRSWSTDAYLDASVFAFVKRLTVITSLTAVVADTGTVVPYKYGETLVLAPVGLLIPRFVWPEKPDLNVGGEFGRAFKIVTALDTETSVAPSFPGDLYWNFGVPCVIVGMFLIGGGYRWYYERFGSGAGYDPVRKAVYGMLYMTALMVEGSVAIVIAGFVKLAIMACIFVWLARYFGLLREAEV